MLLLWLLLLLSLLVLGLPSLFTFAAVRVLTQRRASSSLRRSSLADDNAEGPVAQHWPKTSPPACCWWPVAECGDDARPVADDNAEGPVARGGGAARFLTMMTWAHPPRKRHKMPRVEVPQLREIVEACW